MVRILNGIWNLENGRHFVKHHLKSGQKCLDFEWSSFWMVGTRAMSVAKTQTFEIQTFIRSSNVNRSLWSSFYVYWTLCLQCALVSLACYEKCTSRLDGNYEVSNCTNLNHVSNNKHCKYHCVVLSTFRQTNQLTKLFEIAPSKSLDFKCFRISDPHCN